MLPEYRTVLYATDLGRHAPRVFRHARGLARLANRPYRQLLAASELATIDLSSTRLVRSPEALLRRLDDLTCRLVEQAVVVGLEADADGRGLSHWFTRGSW